MGLCNAPSGVRAPEEVNALVDLPLGISNKFAYDADLDVFVSDRTPYTSLRDPRFAAILALENLPNHQLREVMRYFRADKELED